MNESLTSVVTEPFREFFTRVLSFLPHLFISLLILAVGVVIAVVLEKTLSRLFRAVGVDKLSDKFGMTDILTKGGLREPVSSLSSKIICWITVLIFLIISLRALNVPTVGKLLSDFFLYLPNIFVAMFILLVGYLLSNFLGRTALIASVNAGFRLSGMIAKFVQFTVFFISVAMALEQLGIGKETVLIAFAVIYGGVVFALAIAFGLGARNIAREYIEKRLKGEEEKDDIHHL